MIREATSSLSPAEVLEKAKEFFMSQLSVYSAWLEDESESHVTFSTFRSRIAVSAYPDPEEEAATRIRVSTLRVNEAVGKFLTYIETADSPKVASVPEDPSTKA